MVSWLCTSKRACLAAFGCWFLASICMIVAFVFVRNGLDDGMGRRIKMGIVSWLGRFRY